MTNTDTLQQLILDFEAEFSARQKITLPPGLQEITTKTDEQVLLHLKAASDLINQTTEKYMYYVMQNLSFLEQRQVYNDLSIYSTDYSIDPINSFSELKEKVKTYNQLQKYLVSQEFKKLHKNKEK